MSIESELRSVILGLSAVTDIVGDRVWDEWFRTNRLPAVVFEFDNEAEESDLDGVGGLVFADVNILCRADSRAESRRLSNAVRSGLAGHSGTFDAWLEDRQNAVVPKDDGSSGKWYDTNLSFKLSWTED